ncbi:hypothetical protein [uncultured Alteromonas sp.]|nr:hypothetical protein [uncultured Alteromonas sp.]
MQRLPKRLQKRRRVWLVLNQPPATAASSVRRTGLNNTKMAKRYEDKYS